MPDRPGGAVRTPAVAAVAERSWYAFRRFHPKTSEDPKTAYVNGYRRGVADMVADSLQLGGWDVLTRRLLDVLEELVVEREVVRLVTEQNGAASPEP